MRSTLGKLRVFTISSTKSRCSPSCRSPIQILTRPPRVKINRANASNSPRILAKLKRRRKIPSSPSSLLPAAVSRARACEQIQWATSGRASQESVERTNQLPILGKPEIIPRGYLCMMNTQSKSIVQLRLQVFERGKPIIYST